MSRAPASFALRALLVSALLSLLALLAVPTTPQAPQANAASKLVNPLYDRLQAIGEREGFDVGFAREVVLERQGPTVDHPLFQMPEHGVDVLIFGDSTAAWGISPPVIEAVSGLRVAMFAEPAMRLNEADSAFYQVIIDKYLAPEGRTLFCFAPRNIEQDPDVPSSRTLSGENLARALTAAKKSDGWSFDRYWRWRTEHLSQPLQAAGLRLPRIDLYRSELEPYLNPEWSGRKRKTVTRQAKGFVRWDGWTTTISGPVRQYALRSTTEPKKLARWLPKSPQRERLARNAQAFSRLPGTKLLVVPWSADKHSYLQLRALYREYFAASAGVIDLGKLMPENARYPMSGSVHLKNESGFEASVLLGKWLRQNPVARRSP